MIINLLCPHCLRGQQEAVTVVRKYSIKVCEHCGKGIGYCLDYRKLSKADTLLMEQHRPTKLEPV